MSNAKPEPDIAPRKLLRRAGVVAAGTLFSRLLGLVREQILAAFFSRVATDIFFVAFLIPNVLRQILAEGATQNGVLPVLAQIRQQQGEKRAREFFSALRGLLLLILALVCALGVYLAPFLVELFAGGFKQTPGKLERTISITRWVFPYIFFMGNAALGLAALNTYRRFFITSFAPALLNISFIACALVLPLWFQNRGHDPLMALAVGVLVGGLLQVVAQWPSLKAIGYLSRPRINLGDSGVREVLRRMLPVMFGFGVYYIDVVVARHLLSDMGDGAPSYFTFAQRLCDFPQGIFVMAVQSATLPSLASLAAKRDTSELLNTTAQGLRLALFVALPASILLIVLAQPLVQLVFQRGYFDAAASSETAHALIAQASGLWMVAAVRQLVIVFYALGDTRSPVIVSALDFLAFLALALMLRGPLGHVGISWAVSGASAFQLGLLCFYLRRKVGRLPMAGIIRTGCQTLAAALVAALPAWWLAHLLQSSSDSNWWQRLLPGGVGALAFGSLFLGAALLFRSAEAHAMLAPVLRRCRQRRQSS